MQPFKYNPNLNSGNFRHRIIFQHKVKNAVDGDGFKIPEKEAPYIDLFSDWAMNKTVSGREYVQAAAVQNERIVRWIIRYREDITEDMRIKYGNHRYFNIETILPDDELKKTLTIVCKEVL